MRKFTRGVAPDFLTSNWKKWGERYDQNRQKKAGFKFQWPVHKGSVINVLLEPLLAQLTNDHCSFCDTFPLRTKEDSIEHFKPKSKPAYYGLVCQWENLYYCCQNCQLYKKEQYNQYLLRPDDVAYDFDTYFIYSFATHALSTHPAATDLNKRKAETTIQIFGLNDKGNIAARRISLERYEHKKALNERIEINDFPFRFTILLNQLTFNNLLLKITNAT